MGRYLIFLWHEFCSAKRKLVLRRLSSSDCKALFNCQSGANTPLSIIRYLLKVHSESRRYVSLIYLRNNVATVLAPLPAEIVLNVMPRDVPEAPLSYGIMKKQAYAATEQ